MNPKLPGLLKCLLFLIGIAWATTPVALPAAIPPDTTPDAQAANENTDDTSNPYSVIVERNIFHLNPLPPPPEPEKPKVESPVIKISGFVNIGNMSKVLFVSQPKNRTDPPVYYSLSQGEKSADGKLTLLKIHPETEQVEINNDGIMAVLNLKDDSLVGAAPAAVAPAANGGPPRINPGNGIPGRPMFQPGRNFPPGVSGNGFSFPARTRRNLP